MGFSVSVLGNEPYPLNTSNLTLNKPVLLTYTNIRDKYRRAFPYILYSTVKSSCITKEKVKQVVFEKYP